jgi:hypothetical protein
MAWIAVHVCDHHAFLLDVGVCTDALSSSRGDADASWASVEGTESKVLTRFFAREGQRKVVEACI